MATMRSVGEGQTHVAHTELESAQKALAQAEQNLETERQQSKDALRDVQDRLDKRLDESLAIDNQLLSKFYTLRTHFCCICVCLLINLTSPFTAPAGLGHELTAENRLDRILEMGELIPKILSSGKKLVEKFFPGNPEPLANMTDLPAVPI